MKLPSLQELKRSGHSALKGLDPSALERGLQYLRDGGFTSLDIAVVGGKGMLIEFTLSEPVVTKIDYTTPSQPLFSECNCSMSGYGIYCKHQAIATWVVVAILTQNYDLTRVEDSVIQSIKAFEPVLAKLKNPIPVVTPGSFQTGSIPDRESSNELTSGTTQIGTHFEGIVICFPRQAIQESRLPLELNHTIKKGKNHQDTLLPDLASPFFRESDLPHPLWRSPVSFRGTTNNLFQNPHEQLRRKSIYYIFSDHTRIPVAEILYHRHCTLVPNELLPVASNLHEPFLEKKRLRFFPKSKDVTIWDQKTDDRLDAILLSLMHEAGKLLKRDRLSVYFTYTDGFETDDKVLKLESLELHTPQGLSSGYQVRSLPS